MAEFEYQSAGATEAAQKQALAYLFEQTSVGLATTGTLTGLAVAQTTTASGSVVIAAGASVVQASVLVGASLLVNNTDKTLEVLTTNPMGGLPRNDIVAFDTLTDAIIAIIGTPNASPTDPTVPTTACALARLRHAASATTIPTANIDDLRSFTYLAADDSMPRGYVGAGTDSGDKTGVSGVGNVAIPVIAGRRYRVTAYLTGSQVTSTGNLTVTLKSLVQVGTRNMIDTVSLTTSAVRTSHASMIYTAGSTVSETFYMSLTSSAGAFRILSGGATVTVEDIGY